MYLVLRPDTKVAAQTPHCSTDAGITGTERSRLKNLPVLVAWFASLLTDRFTSLHRHSVSSDLFVPWSRFFCTPNLSTWVFSVETLYLQDMQASGIQDANGDYIFVQTVFKAVVLETKINPALSYIVFF